ncbi:MAG: hydrogenase nickel incorporation protein HypB [Synechococcaceae cyanobacterium RL_1_2]|nr:hydrogenase nickel incorporation protein HypB [Synechococcaceae cyanobacterium RL_1_2]
MCIDCGCSAVATAKTEQDHQNHGAHHDHDHHGHDHHDDPFHHGHSHDHLHHSHEISVGQAILAKNNHLADHNRQYFRELGLLVINVLSSPGSGKTTLIQHTINELKGSLQAGVVVGDLATDNDAQRLLSTGAPVHQISTGTVCHLEADMVKKAADRLPLKQLDLLIIENVGNLVCPAAYDLGEDLRIVLLSVTEGEDKPLKYPTMFKSADVVILTKMDLAEAVEFDRNTAIANIKKVVPTASILELSARKQMAMEPWLNYLKTKTKELIAPL